MDLPMGSICRVHASLGVTQSEMEHSTGSCFKLLDLAKNK